MRFGELVHLVWINILESKSKVFLTSLGVIVGAATIVLVVAVGHGGEVQVQEQYKTLNAGSINVSVSTQAEMRDQIIGGMAGGGPFGGEWGGQAPGGETGGYGNRTAGGGGAPAGGAAGGFAGRSGGTARKQTVTLSGTDVEDIADLVPGLSYLSLYNTGTASVNGGDLTEDTDCTVVGVSPNYKDMCNLELLEGGFLTEDDVDGKSKTAVIGYTLAQNIFGSAYSAYGENLVIEGKTYEIAGVLAKMGSVSSGTSPDDSIFLPYSTGVKYVFGNDADPQIMAIAADVNDVESVIGSIKAVLSDDHPDASFTVADAGGTLESATASARTLSSLLLAVAAIVFVVGGIGIMNVMFVSVKERTQEIGILKALGTSRGEILLEFLLEAMSISILGGILGVAAGFALVPAARLAGITVEPLAASGAYAMAFAVVTGTAFGFYPAWKASRLLPVEALAQE